MHHDDDPASIEGTSWRLARGVAVPDGSTITARFVDGTVSGHAAVNRYRATYELSGGRLRIGPAATTRMAGPDAAMAAEAAYLTLLGAVAGQRLEDGGRALALLDASGDEILGFSAGPDVADALVGRWEVRGIHQGEALASPAQDSTPWLAFDGAGQVEGHGGVNRLHGTARVDGDRLFLGPLGSTRMAGPPEAMDAEGALLAALEAVAGFRLEGTDLELVDADGQTQVQLVRAGGAA